MQNVSIPPLNSNCYQPTKIYGFRVDGILGTDLKLFPWVPGAAQTPSSGFPDISVDEGQEKKGGNGCVPPWERILLQTPPKESKNLIENLKPINPNFSRQR